MFRFPFVRSIVTLFMVAFLLCLSFAFLSKPALAHCGFGVTSACVTVSPQVITSNRGCISFTVYGKHWPSGDIKLSILHSGSPSIDVGTTVADSTGNFTFPVSNLCGISPGTYTLKAVDTTHGTRSLSGFSVR